VRVRDGDVGEVFDESGRHSCGDEMVLCGEFFVPSIVASR